MAKKNKVPASQSKDLINLLGSAFDSSDIAKVLVSPNKSVSRDQSQDKQKKKKATYSIRARLLKSGRGINPVTEIYDWPTHLSERDLKTLLRRLKKELSVGGTLKSKTIELQGDQLERASKLLANENFKLVKSGG